MSDIVQNAFVRNFVYKLEKTHGDCWWFGSRADDLVKKISKSDLVRGKQLVKPAMYHIRRWLAGKSNDGRSIDYHAMVAIFSGPENLDEILNLGGFPLFWENPDRSQRGYIIRALSRIAGPGDQSKIKEFKDRLSRIEYYEPRMNSHDRIEFQPVLEKISKANYANQ